MAYIDDEKIAEIKNALTIIQLNAELLFGRLKYVRDENRPEKIVKQVKRIDRLLPKIKYGKEKCLVYVDERNQEKKGEKGENR